MDVKQVLLVGLGAEEAAVRQSLSGMEVEILSADRSGLHRKISQIFLDPGEEAAGETMKPAIILFRNFRQEELDPVLKAIRGAGLSHQPLKAMVTPTNWNWSLDTLYGELQQENLVMGALFRLKKLRDSMPMPDYMDIPAMKAWLNAERLLHGGEDVTVQAIEAACKELQKFAH